LIGEATRRHGDEPAFRIVGHSLFRPLHRRGDQRLLHRVLASAEVAVAAEQDAQNLRGQVAQQVLSAGLQAWGHGVQSVSGPLIPWRPSIGMFSGLPPGPGAADASAAIAYARSGLSTSTIQ